VVNHKNVVQRKIFAVWCELIRDFGKPHWTRVLVGGTGEETIDARLVMKNFHRTAQGR